jgi:hypothetical protein
MKKTRLASDYSYDFTVLGLTSVAKEYKLAWSMNHALHLNLKKQNDITIQFLNNSSLVISNYLHQSENSSIRLLKNKSFAVGDDINSLYLVPELKNMDYLILINDEAGAIDVQEIIENISRLDIVEFVTRIDTEKLKSKENLIFE